MREPRRPVSTYRLQLGPELRFADALGLVPYLDALGISDCYTSPLLKSASGSQHGYDICDHAALSPVLGTDEDFEALACEIRSRGMGLLVDFVPNHMGLDVGANAWWRDVLEHGRSSVYADYFDIDWAPSEPALKDRILLPILQDAYGDVLHRGDIRLDYANGGLEILYGDRRLPVEPHSSVGILQREPDTAEGAWQDFDEVLGLLNTLPSCGTDHCAAKEMRRRQSMAARARLSALVESTSAIRAHVEAVLAAVNGRAGQPASFDRLHELLERQPYRLAHWKTALDEINYRRFFDVNDLGALRMEDERVFDAAHVRILDLIGRGDITGLRIDHPDGLLEPRVYFERLQAAIARARASHPAEGREDDRFYLVAEKILADGEALPDDWPIAGTTGYGFLNDVGRLFIDLKREEALRSAYQRLTGRRDSFEEVAYDSKQLVMTSSMASELAVLSQRLKRIANSDRSTRDFTLTALRRTLGAVCACFPVYRTYVSRQGFTATDRQRIDHAVDVARRRNPVIAPALFLFVRNVLLAEAGTPGVAERREFAMKFQQFTAPVEAKGVEDTSFYRYTMLLSLNEVGGDPRRFGASVDHFHAGNRVRQERWPYELLATATHDTKRGEDARARLHALSEMPRAWAQAVSRWRSVNAVHRTAVDRESAPDANDEYLFYQTIVGSWPTEALDEAGWTTAAPAFADRIQTYMRKAIREAKTHTSWLNQNTPYEDAVSQFVASTLTDAGGRAFVQTCLPFIRRVAALGMLNSLAQLVLKIGSPGVPDFYQGTEQWQLELADPDNRRPVDFSLRQTMLERLMPCVASAEARRAAGAGEPPRTPLEARVGEFVRHWTDGRIKMFVTACALRLRRSEPDLFTRGDYVPLTATGPKASHLVAFARSFARTTVVVIVPRLVGGLTPAPEDGICRSDLWHDTQIALPPALATYRFVHAFTGAFVQPARDEHHGLAMADICRTCPVAVLVSAR